MIRKRKKDNLSPESAADLIRDLISGGTVRDARHAVEKHPYLEPGLQLFEGGSSNTASRGSGAVAATPPDF